LLRWRLFSAAVFIAVLVGFFSLDFHYHEWIGASGAWLIPVVLLMTGLATSEVLDLLAARDLRPNRWSVYVGTMMVVLATCTPILWDFMETPYPPDCPLGKLGWPLAAMALAVILVFVGEMCRYKEPGGVIVNVAMAIFVVTYVGLMFSFLVALRLFAADDHKWGMAALLSLIVVVKMSDVGAYFTGRLMGKHKMAPRLSPGKTIEGAVGGIVTACLTSLAYFYWLVPKLVGADASLPGWWGCLLFALVVTIAGMVGDLAESLIKRDADRKDSSSWLPGLGGILDTVDSLLIAAPFAFFCWAAGIVGP
jgi:phosphatidate cytidylyltransferase